MGFPLSGAGADAALGSKRGQRWYAADMFVLLPKTEIPSSGVQSSLCAMASTLVFTNIAGSGMARDCSLETVKN